MGTFRTKSHLCPQQPLFDLLSLYSPLVLLPSTSCPGLPSPDWLSSLLKIHSAWSGAEREARVPSIHFSFSSATRSSRLANRLQLQVEQSILGLQPWQSLVITSCHRFNSGPGCLYLCGTRREKNLCEKSNASLKEDVSYFSCCLNQAKC